MIVTDDHGYVVQHRFGDEHYLDGGDSARSMGLMAMAGEHRSRLFVHAFVILGDGVRHPSQKKNNNNNPNNFTREQLLPLMAGLYTADRINTARRLFWAYAKRGFLGQNTHDQEGNLKPWYKGRDILHPGHIGHLIRSAKITLFYPLLPICNIFLFFDMLYSSWVVPEKEQNQIISMLSVAGRMWLKMYVFVNRSWKSNLMVYWGGWRDQKEIAEMIIKYVERTIS